MKLETPKCPDCGEYASATVDTLYAHAPLSEPDEDGHQDNYGESKLLWDTQESAEDPETGGIYVRCHNGHEWSSKVQES